MRCITLLSEVLAKLAPEGDLHVVLCHVAVVAPATRQWWWQIT
jgi:hypothetical protein